MRGPTPLFLHGNAADFRKGLQVALILESSVDRDLPPARGCATPRHFCPDGVECGLSTRTAGNRWTGSDQQFPAQQKRHHNQGILDRGSTHAQGELRLRPDASETPPGSQLLLTPG